MPRSGRPRLYTTAAATVAALALVLLGPTVRAEADRATPGGAPGTAADSTAPLYLVRVPVTSDARLRTLEQAGIDVLEARRGAEVYAIADAAALARMRGLGFTPTIEQSLPPAPKVAAGGLNQTFAGGYRTVEEQLAHVDAVAAARPDLATAVTYGQSWRKANGVPGGYDLKAICLTRKQAGDCAQTPTAPKPRFFLMAHIHARELTTGDLAYRWIDDLVTGYGVDPEVTALMDSTEMWVVPVVNPDGLSIVQRGGNAPYLQRKNARPTSTQCANPPTSSSQAGVDLNRNYGARWGGAGTSTNLCAQTYPGARADSEPETTALEALFGRLFADQRGPGAGDAAPATTRGTMITLHSYSNLILFPWGYDSRVKAPNDAGLRALAARLAGITGYRYGQPGEILYNASGGTDDWTYDRLGIASFTFEVGPTSGSCGGFTPPYSCQSSTFWPLIRPALRYAARTAGSPYRLPATTAPLVPAG